MSWELPGRTGGLEGKLAFVRAMTRPYNGDWWLFPDVGTTGHCLHPLR